MLPYHQCYHIAKLHIFADIQRIPLKFSVSLLSTLNYKNIYQLLNIVKYFIQNTLLF